MGSEEANGGAERLPLPEGEGRGEGERHAGRYLCSKTDLRPWFLDGVTPISHHELVDSMGRTVQAMRRAE